MYKKAFNVQAEDLETEKASLESSLEHKERLLKEAREEAMAARRERGLLAPAAAASSSPYIPPHSETPAILSCWKPVPRVASASSSSSSVILDVSP